MLFLIVKILLRYKYLFIIKNIYLYKLYGYLVDRVENREIKSKYIFKPSTSCHTFSLMYNCASYNSLQSHCYCACLMTFVINFLLSSLFNKKKFLNLGDEIFFEFIMKLKISKITQRPLKNILPSLYTMEQCLSYFMILHWSFHFFLCDFNNFLFCSLLLVSSGNSLIKLQSSFNKWITSLIHFFLSLSHQQKKNKKQKYVKLGHFFCLLLGTI